MKELSSLISEIVRSTGAVYDVCDHMRVVLLYTVRKPRMIMTNTLARTLTMDRGKVSIFFMRGYTVHLGKMEVEPVSLWAVQGSM